MSHLPMHWPPIHVSIGIGQKSKDLNASSGMPIWAYLLLQKILRSLQIIYNAMCHLVFLDYFLTYNFAYAAIIVIPLGILYLLIIYTKVPTRES